MRTTEEFIDNHLDELLNGEDLRETFDSFICHPVTRFEEGVYQDNKGNTLEIESITEDIYLNRIAAVVFNNNHFTKNIQQYQDVEFITLNNGVTFYAK
jgi:hypothetical protein